MKKSITVHYDDEIDNELINYINSAKGKSSRSAFIMNLLYDLKNGKLNYGLPSSFQIVTPQEPLKVESEKIEIKKEIVNDFKKKFGK